MGSILILLGGLAILYFAGLPVTILLFESRGKKPTANTIWALAPFIGFSIISIVLKSLVAFDLPIRLLAWPLLGLLAIVFFIYCVRRGLLNIPLPEKSFWFGLIFVLLAESIPYIIIGAKFYKGFGFEDLFFYSSQAQALIDLPLSKVDQQASIQPFLSVVMHNNHGYHRLGRAVLQSFYAVLFHVDAASIIGFMSILGPVLVYHSLLYLTEGTTMRRFFRYAACVTGATLPMVTLTHLEGFIPVCLFISASILMCKLFAEATRKLSAGLIIAAAMILACFISVLTDGTYVALGLLLLCAILNAIRHEKPWLPLTSMVLVAALAIIIDIQFLWVYRGELSMDVQHSQLNGIYSFAYTMRGLTWIFFGSPFEFENGRLVFVLRVMSLILTAMGLFGLLYAAVRKRTIIVISSNVLAFSAGVFLCFHQDQQYAFFKLLQLGIPLFMVGAWYTLDIIVSELSTLIQQNAFRQGFLRLCRGMAVGCVTFIMVLTVAASTIRIAATLHFKDTRVNQNSRIWFLLSTNDTEPLRQFQELENMKGRNVLLVGINHDFNYWWMTYYARNNTVYSMPESVDDLYWYTDSYFTNPNNIPQDVKIMWSVNAYKMHLSQANQENLASILTYKDTSGALFTPVPHDAPSQNAYELRIFSKAPVKATFELILDPASSIEGVSVNGVAAKDDHTITLPVDIAAGYTTLPIVSDQGKPLSLSDWTLILP